ncbi:MAG TPA: lipopolysaccharide heptosyltransferase II [Candidatus Acidoferrales bacterium]|nr:lipopolysaccharide heptosyltransferase II [Candidatus Acidoferrales bacterium]
MKILVRSTNWVGDAIMSLPALQALRQHWPDAETALLAKPWVADLLRGQEIANQLIVYDSKGLHRGAWGRERLARELRRENFDLAVLFQNAFDAAWIAWRAGIPERIGYARDARSWLLTQAIAVPKPGETRPHECYYYLELLRRAGWLDELPVVTEIRLTIPGQARETAEDRLRQGGLQDAGLRVAIAPGANYGAARCWMPERFASLADRFVDEFGADVILFGAPAEEEIVRRIAAGMRHRSLNLAGQTSIGDLPGLLSCCHIFIGNDSGAMHVAGAVGLRTLGIFGPTDPQGTSPMTPNFRMVRHPVECSPCFLRRCPIDHRCMTRISVDDAYAAAHRWAMELAGGAHA